MLQTTPDDLTQPVLVAPPDGNTLTSEMLASAITSVEYGVEGAGLRMYVGYVATGGKDRRYIFHKGNAVESYDEKQLSASALLIMKLERFK